MIAVVMFLPVTPSAQAAATFKSNLGFPPFWPVFFCLEANPILYGILSHNAYFAPAQDQAFSDLPGTIGVGKADQSDLSVAGDRRGSRP